MIFKVNSAGHLINVFDMWFLTTSIFSLLCALSTFVNIQPRVGSALWHRCYYKHASASPCLQPVFHGRVLCAVLVGLWPSFNWLPPTEKRKANCRKEDGESFTELMSDDWGNFSLFLSIYSYLWKFCFVWATFTFHDPWCVRAPALRGSSLRWASRPFQYRALTRVSVL